MELFEYLDRAVTPYHAVALGCSRLRDAGFIEQKLEDSFTPERGKRYFIPVYGTGLIAYSIGEEFSPEDGLRIAAAHTDAPCLRVKPRAELLAGEYKRLDIEVYGGAIFNTWFDRPLSLAGRVVLRGKDAFSPEVRTVDFNRPLLTVPNLAIHMNREVNKGVEYKPQRDLLPLLGMLGEEEPKESYVRALLAKELQVEADAILDYDLTVYCKEAVCSLGEKGEFISGPRLDNQLSCYGLLETLCKAEHKKGIHVAVLYDHEEVGSRSKQGADSGLTGMVLERIYTGLGAEKEQMYAAFAKSILLSVDGAHALHPNRQDAYDPVNRATLNKGVALKINSSQRYAYDAETVAIVQVLCEEAGVPYQKVANHADLAGGSTLGPIISSWIPVRTVDLGVPMLAMHSARELCGMEDVDNLVRLLTRFYE